MVILGVLIERKQVPMAFGCSGMKSYKVALLSKCTELQVPRGCIKCWRNVLSMSDRMNVIWPHISSWYSRCFTSEKVKYLICDKFSVDPGSPDILIE